MHNLNSITLDFLILLNSRISYFNLCHRGLGTWLLAFIQRRKLRTRTDQPRDILWTWCFFARLVLNRFCCLKCCLLLLLFTYLSLRALSLGIACVKIWLVLFLRLLGNSLFEHCVILRLIFRLWLITCIRAVVLRVGYLWLAHLWPLGRSFRFVVFRLND